VLHDWSIGSDAPFIIEEWLFSRNLIAFATSIARIVGFWPGVVPKAWTGLQKSVTSQRPKSCDLRKTPICFLLNTFFIDRVCNICISCWKSISWIPRQMKWDEKTNLQARSHCSESHLREIARLCSMSLLSDRVLVGSWRRSWLFVRKETLWGREAS